MHVKKDVPAFTNHGKNPKEKNDYQNRDTLNVLALDLDVLKVHFSNIYLVVL